jgi:hypothetical protein
MKPIRFANSIIIPTFRVITCPQEEEAEDLTLKAISVENTDRF